MEDLSDNIPQLIDRVPRAHCKPELDLAKNSTASDTPVNPVNSNSNEGFIVGKVYSIADGVLQQEPIYISDRAPAPEPQFRCHCTCVTPTVFNLFV